MERHCGQRKHSHNTAAHACRSILLAFSNTSGWTFSTDAERYESCSNVGADDAEQDCLSRTVIEALRELATPLPPGNCTNDCSEKESQFCNPFERFHTTQTLQAEAFDLYIPFTVAMLLGQIVFFLVI